MKTPSTAAPRLALHGISKRYASVIANDRVDLAVAAGEIHALLGENGAGKSTLMKIVYGVTQPDAGSIEWEGSGVAIGSPAQARRLGIGMVFQHFSIFETLTVAENIALALNERLPAATLAARIDEVSRRYGLPIDPQRLTHGMSVGERQRVEIVRCLLQSPRLLIMDEPTSVLTPQAVRVLFETLRRLAALAGAYLFGSVTVLQLYAQGLGVHVPSDFLSMLPYAATIVVLVAICRDPKTILLNQPASLGRSFHPGY